MAKRKKRRKRIQYLPIVVLNANLPPRADKHIAKPYPIAYLSPWSWENPIHEPAQNAFFYERRGFNKDSEQSSSSVSDAMILAGESGSYSGGHSGGGCCKSGLSSEEGAIFLGALALAVLYLNQVIMDMKKRRRRREAAISSDKIGSRFHGMVDFENKIDQIASKEDKDPNNWINKLAQGAANHTSNETRTQDETHHLNKRRSQLMDEKEDAGCQSLFINCLWKLLSPSHLFGMVPNLFRPASLPESGQMKEVQVCFDQIKVCEAPRP